MGSQSPRWTNAKAHRPWGYSFCDRRPRPATAWRVWSSSLKQRPHRDELRRVPRHGSRQIFKAGRRIDVFEVDFGEGVSADPDGDQAWPDRLTAVRIQRIDNTIENHNIDVALAVEFEDGGKRQQRELRNSTGVQRFYLRRWPRRLDNRLTALDVTV